MISTSVSAAERRILFRDAVLRSWKEAKGLRGFRLHVLARVWHNVTQAVMHSEPNDEMTVICTPTESPYVDIVLVALRRNGLLDWGGDIEVSVLVPGSREVN